ncbi:MAG: hypothetical protein GX606_03160 [Elusimicrobia bacterium]|nr:hypothetical protein [Elusimicrobiota bacterium]
MTRDEIYDHLAKVYLGKRGAVEEKRPPRRRFSAWLVINIVITAFILASVFWGLTAFFTRHDDLLKSRIIYTLTNSPLRLTYNVGKGLPQVKELKIGVPSPDVSRYQRINLSVRSFKGANPGRIKVILTNAKAERAAYYLDDIKARWQEYSIRFDELNLTDWKTLKDIAFVVEAWNADRTSGSVLIDNISFAN